ncbi:hypothetical protein D0T49_12410 [Paludibacter sp. 221]|uniref:hypothetical protein n=1 Tax=Paludibacter sp. 221 TaxID=2302939 RepID=UPI0013D4DEF6|nr:hypothetical protein [Paludibacter sp. 221]NDV47849.1 hypothetical protein [Paludibacter sp. 221]
MKKTLLIGVLFLISAFYIKAQLTLTPDGFKSTEDSTKEFLVYTFENQSQEKLYKSTLKFLNTVYNTPLFVLSTVDNETITISAKSEVGEGKMGNNTYVNVFKYNYSFSIMFKENRIRIDLPFFSFERSSNGRSLVLSDGAGPYRASIFNKKGKVTMESAKEKMENDMNAIINGIIKSINSSDDW